MALVNPEILRHQQSPDLMQAAGQGLQMRGLLRQDQKAQRMQAFEQAFTQASQGMDLSSEDNLRATLQKTVQQFPEESLEVFKKYREVFPQPAKPPADSWDHVYGTDQIYNRKDGQFRQVPKAPAPDPTQPSNPSAWKGEKFVRSKGNTMVKVDASGKDKDGNVVELWSPPAKPKAMPTPKPPSPVKGLSGDASKLLSISWTLQDDISAMNKAFQDNYEGAIAGMKSGTNKRLMDLADQIADKVGRLRSGGAVNADEEKRFMRLIATLRGAAFSNASEAMQTLNSLAREGAIIAEAMDPGGGHRKRITESMRPAGKADPKSLTKPEEEDEYQAWKKAQGIK